MPFEQIEENEYIISNPSEWFADQHLLTLPGEDRILEKPPVAKSQNLC
jgi:hypothetical protein